MIAWSGDSSLSKRPDEVGFGEFRLSGNRELRLRCEAASVLMQGYSYSAPRGRYLAGKNILLVSWFGFTVEYLA